MYAACMGRGNMGYIAKADLGQIHAGGWGPALLGQYSKLL